jgi:hypothetical protein
VITTELISNVLKTKKKEFSVKLNLKSVVDSGLFKNDQNVSIDVEQLKKLIINTKEKQIELLNELDDHIPKIKKDQILQNNEPRMQPPPIS